MQYAVSILFWAGIMLLLDGSLALLFKDRWQKVLRQWNLKRIALIEIGIAWMLLATHYLLLFVLKG